MANRTIIGIAPPDAGGTPAPPAVENAPPAARRESRDSFPSDFPVALGSLDESDLPVVSGDLPARPEPAAGGRAAPPRKPPVAPHRATSDTPSLELDLPAKPTDRAPDLPALPAPKEKGVGPSPQAVKGFGQASFQRPASGASPSDPPADLPAVAGEFHASSVGLPVVAAGLPVVTPASLPLTAAGLPMRAASLPVAAESLPTARKFGPFDLPATAEVLPVTAPTERHLPVPAPDADLGGFGEIDLPREQPPSSRSPLPAADASATEPFGQLQRGRATGGNSTAPSPQAPGRGAGGTSFGEVDFGVSDASGPEPGADLRTSIAPSRPPVDRPSGAAGAASWAPPPPAADAPPAPVAPAVRRAPRRLPPDATAKTRRVGPVAAMALGLSLVVAGAALHLTPYGAFGYLAIGDLVRAGDYARATEAAIRDAQARLALDTYDAAKSAVEAAFAAHARMPRDRSLTAYAAVLDYATTVRFGADTARVSRANQLLAELPPDANVPYRDVAAAAQLACNGDVDGARRALEVARGRYAREGAARDFALLQGDLALAAGDGSAAVAAFKQALSLGSDARAHFGLARAYDRLADPANAAREVEATLSTSPRHPGALTLRARSTTAPLDGTRALADLTNVLEGPARALASPSELSDAYAARAWMDLERGAASAAGEAFTQAVKLNPGNVLALNGEGRLLLGEGRYAEALARFDTALKVEPDSPAAIASDAEAKIALERLEDAKAQLVAARARFPKSIPVLLILGKAEQHLGNDDAAEADLRAAIASVDPRRPDAVQPYVALCELQSARGRLSDAHATLDEAKSKLPPSPALEIAFGEISELQGDYDGALAHYRAAIAKDPKDAAAHFRLAVALRRTRHFDEARAELEAVAAVDREYPGLLLERGLLFEDSGEVEKAIDQFKTALGKAPDDPDLQLRVGAAYVAIGHPDDALPMLRKVLEKRPASAEANHYIGRALMLKGGPLEADALHYLKRATELDPNRAEFHVYFAWAANDATPAQLEVARDEVDRALALDKLSAEAYWQRGVLERMEGADDDAIKDEKHALELRPSRFEAHATLAECYEDKNEVTAALAEWPRAIAGDARGSSPDEATPHPYWHYRYGKLLFEKGARAAALAQLLPAVGTAEKIDVRPGWLAPMEFLTAEALRGLGRRSDAVEHYQRFLDIAPVNSPDRYDAQRALQALGGGSR